MGINALTGQKAAAKNHLHALAATQETPKAVLKDAKLAIEQLEKRIDRLTADALALTSDFPELARVLALLTGIKGIAETSAIALIPTGTSGRIAVVAAQPHPPGMGQVRGA